MRLQLIPGPAHPAAGTVRHGALPSTQQGLGRDQWPAAAWLQSALPRHGAAPDNPWGPQERSPLNCSSAGFVRHLSFFLLMTKGGRVIMPTLSSPWFSVCLTLTSQRLTPTRSSH